MPYKIEVYRFRQSNEIEYKYMGKYGAKGEKRAKKEKPTPEQIQKQNQKNREIKMRRLIKANYKEDDYWTTLKFPKGTRMGLDQLNKCLRSFKDSMRRSYRKQEEQFKWIERKEIGERGGIHVHMLINRIEGVATDTLIKKAWKKAGGGTVNFQCLYEQGGYEELAAYIVKKPNDEVEKQLSFLPEEERKHFVKVSTSRNLIRPQPEVSVYKRRTLRKLFEEGPKITPGYYIDKNSIVCGVNPYTGMSYYRYTEYRIGTEDGKAPPWMEWEGGFGDAAG